MTFWDPGKWRVEQRRQSFLTHTNLKIAPSLLVISVPWQDLQKKNFFFFCIFSLTKTMGSPATRQRKKSILAMYHVTNRIRAMIYVWMDADWISWGLKHRHREKERERKRGVGVSWTAVIIPPLWPDFFSAAIIPLPGAAGCGGRTSNVWNICWTSFSLFASE